jgi:hypothetical protein
LLAGAGGAVGSGVGVGGSVEGWVGRLVGVELVTGGLGMADGVELTPHAASPVATEPAAIPRRSVRREITRRGGIRQR